MRRTIAICLLLVVAACASPAATQLYNAKLAYVAALDTAAAVYEAGYMSDETYQDIEEARAIAHLALTIAEEQLTAGDMDDFERAMSMLYDALRAMRALTPEAPDG